MYGEHHRKRFHTEALTSVTACLWYFRHFSVAITVLVREEATLFVSCDNEYNCVLVKKIVKKRFRKFGNNVTFIIIAHFLKFA